MELVWATFWTFLPSLPFSPYDKHMRTVNPLALTKLETIPKNWHHAGFKQTFVASASNRFSQLPDNFSSVAVLDCWNVTQHRLNRTRQSHKNVTVMLIDPTQYICIFRINLQYKSCRYLFWFCTFFWFLCLFKHPTENALFLKKQYEALGYSKWQ